ncbi:MAG: hypothetical protein Q8P95_05005 [bacterium]|nr:hypothetical protein [bacterium]
MAERPDESGDTLTRRLNELQTKITKAVEKIAAEGNQTVVGALIRSKVLIVFALGPAELNKVRLDYHNTVGIRELEKRKRPAAFRKFAKSVAFYRSKDKEPWAIAMQLLPFISTAVLIALENTLQAQENPAPESITDRRIEIETNSLIVNGLESGIWRGRAPQLKKATRDDRRIPPEPLLRMLEEDFATGATGSPTLRTAIMDCIRNRVPDIRELG